MPKLKYYFYKVLSVVCRGGHKWLIEYYRKCGMIIGKETRIFSHIISAEPYLIEIGDHCTISTDVSFLTHDACIGALTDRNTASDLCGSISIGSHCFIGSGAIILYGVSIADGCVVAAGSVVTKSVRTKNMILGGNPAKTICNTEDFIDKNRTSFFALHGLSHEQRKNIILANQDKLIHK